MTAFKPLIIPDTREGALQAARDFAPRAGASYPKNRSTVAPGHPDVSRLAAAVRVRLLRESELAQAALDEHKSLFHCEKFVQECHWRSYWRTWLELRPQIWTDFQSRTQSKRDGLAKVQANRIERIEAGDSGVGIVDEFSRELRETGFLHNHARMWFAAYWIHVERLPYELGADFFDRHLICACPASNTLSWRWVAGVQTRGKAYLARRGNLEKYCDPAYLEAGGLRAFENEREAPIPDEPSYEPRTPPYSSHAEDGGMRAGLWISEDDLSPETSQLRALKPTAICTSVVAAPHESERSNGLRRAYRLRAAQDAGARAEQHWGAQTSPIEVQAPQELAAEMLKWAQEHKLQTVFALKPFVGPTNDALPQIEAALREAGVSLVLLRRDEDARMFPFAHKGYFAFWQGVKKNGSPLLAQ